MGDFVLLAKFKPTRGKKKSLLSSQLFHGLELFILFFTTFRKNAISFARNRNADFVSNPGEKCSGIPRHRVLCPPVCLR
jgi:hypothetical protein